jgi:[acyl-carrier-protein] S-malonyltransferase
VINILADGADSFVEVGPGSALQGMIKKVDRVVPTSGINTFQG